MHYVFKCVTKDCENKGEHLTRQLSVNDRNVAQYCSECNEKLERVFVAPALKTAGDGFKA